MIFESPDTVEARGKVKWFRIDYGFGFIEGEGGGRDIFFHQTDIQMDGFRTLSTGQAVKYQLMNSGKGPKATKVIPIKI